MVEVLDQGMEVDLCGLLWGVQEERVEERDENRLIGSELCLGLEFFEERDANEERSIGMSE